MKYCGIKKKFFCVSGDISGVMGDLNVLDIWIQNLMMVRIFLI